MKTGIVINLNYTNIPYEDCQIAWARIFTRMVDAGFRIDGRVFVSPHEQQEAGRLAREALDIDNNHRIQGRLIIDYLKNFYTYDLTTTENLLVPPVDQIEVERAS